MSFSTRSGHLVPTVWDLQPDHIELSDIMYALAHQARFNGHYGPWSVLQHSLLCCALLPIDAPSADKLAAFTHDFAEAYTGDLVTGVKKTIVGVKAFGGWMDWAAAEKQLTTDVIFPGLGIDRRIYALPWQFIDRLVLVVEASQFGAHWAREYQHKFDLSDQSIVEGLRIMGMLQESTSTIDATIQMGFRRFDALMKDWSACSGAKHKD